MPAHSLPENPSLEHLKKDAKRLHKGVRAGNAEALALVREFHPRVGEAIADFSLSDSQRVLARSYGFANWPKLKKHLEVVGQFGWNPPAETRSPVDTFLRLACVDYGGWQRSGAQKARRMLAEHPELARENIYAAAAAGDFSAAKGMLDREAAAANAKGGPLGWEPLLYACYSRVDSIGPDYSTREVARLLLAHGADPNAGFLWHGLIPPFTALTGAFGEGERDEPPHEHRDALARLLLDAGADPNDEQTLYNRHFNRNDDHLTLLFSYGLGHDQGGPWFKRLGERLNPPARLLVEELWSAARKNFPDRVKLLVEHRADLNTPGLRDGRTPYEAAVRAGNEEIAAYLLQHGARKIELTPEEKFAAACINGRRHEVLAMLADDPKLLENLGHHQRVELLHRAVEAKRLEGVRLMAEMGFEISGKTHHDSVGVNLAATPLHNAANNGNLEMVKLLIELGADTNIRDPTYHGTPIGWAAYGRQQEVVEYLMAFATIFDAVQYDGVERAAALLQKDRSLANAVDDDGDPLVFYLHPALKRLDAMIDLLLVHGADLNARNRSGKTLLQRALANGQDDFATALRQHGATI